MLTHGIAVEYRHTLGEIWPARACKRKLDGEKFEHDLAAVARQKLDAAYASAASTAERHELQRATAALNRADDDEAAAAGLLP